MNIAVFCYLGLLRFPEQVASYLSLMSDSRKAEAEDTLAKLLPLSKAELLQQWGTLRDTEYAAMRRGVSERIGIDLDELPPVLQAWCVSWWADHNG